MKLPESVLMRRSYFEDDTEFPDSLKDVLTGYGEAASRAFHSAHRAASTGEREAVRKAQWWEGVTRTIEKCLCSFIDKDCEFDLPDPPNFDI